MASPLFFLLLLLSILSFSAANHHKTAPLYRSQLLSDAAATATAAAPPTTYFEVSKPITPPNTKPCSYLALKHDFAFTYAKPPVLAHYRPPSGCPSLQFSKIVLEWNATSKGRQFDRIFGVWLGGAEILRSCTAEPRSNGIFWTVKKDVTRYYSLLMTNQTLAVYLGNLVDDTYTGVYHVNVTFHFYPSEVGNGESYPEFELGFSRADSIIPISRNLPLNDGLWFEIENSTDVESKEFMIPQNVYRAVLEVYVSFHENDEFWYGNLPNEYISANNLTGASRNGPFREVVVSLDGMVVGVVWPFTVIYTGGVNPLLWRPITGIGSFDLPSYDIDVTPFLGKLLDGKSHTIAFEVTNALNVWYVDANLHLWLDKKSERTQGKLLNYNESPLYMSLFANFTGLNGLFITHASRSIVSTGWVKSSHGKVMTRSKQELEYSNKMVMGHDGDMQILDQVITFNRSVVTDKPSSPLLRSTESRGQFSLYLHTDDVDNGNGSYNSVANVSLGFDEKASIFGVSTSRVKNVQRGEGSMLVKGNLVVSGVGSTQQEYSYTSDKLCYFRNVSSSNYTIVHDEEGNTCKSNGLFPFFTRRNVFGSLYSGEKIGLI